MKRYNLSDDAKQDMANIRAYITNEGGATAARYVLKQIKVGIEFLSRTPSAGHLREDLTDADVKFWPVFSYLIIYKSTVQPIVIARVLHGSRDISPMLLQDD